VCSGRPAATPPPPDIDEVFWRLSEAFSEEACMELMMLAGFYRTVSLLVNGLRLEPEAFAAPFPA